MKSSFPAMYRFLVFLFLIVQLLCVALLWLSCFPGALEDATIPLVIIVAVLLQRSGILIFLILAVIGTAVWQRRSRQHSQRPSEALSLSPHPRRYPKQLTIVTCLVLVITSVLLKINLPQKIAFSISRPAFEAFIADTAKVDKLCGQTFKQPLGLYQVEECDHDPRGGIYLRTGLHDFMFTSTYGFVHQPNPHGSERFGEDVYEYGSVVDDWYWFRAAPDW